MRGHDESDTTALVTRSHDGDDYASEEEAPPAVFVENVHKTYLLGVDGVTALRGVSLTVARGEILMLLGASGGGKTSLLNVMSTIDRPSRGNVRLCGVPITSRTQDSVVTDLRLRRIGLVFQSFNLISNLSAVENVRLPMDILGSLSMSDRNARALSLLSAVGLKERASHMPGQMSGGEQQRVAIARALANQPEVTPLHCPAFLPRLNAGADFAARRANRRLRQRQHRYCEDILTNILFWTFHVHCN